VELSCFTPYLSVLQSSFVTIYLYLQSKPLMAATNKGMTDYQDKVQIGAEHVEGGPDLKHQPEVILKSGLDELGLWVTVKRFRKVRFLRSSNLLSNGFLTLVFKAVIICQLLCIAAAADGYQYTLNG
jgi:hypothetical protein